jgi:hypothetical protein
MYHPVPTALCLRGPEGDGRRKIVPASLEILAREELRRIAVVPGIVVVNEEGVEDGVSSKE